MSEGICPCCGQRDLANLKALPEASSVKTVNLLNRQWEAIDLAMTETGKSRSLIVREAVELWEQARADTESAAAASG